MIKLKNISKNFLDRKLFENVNIELPLNQLTCIVGESGSGKTTLLNMIAGLEDPSSGNIVLETENESIDLKNNTGLIDFVFQDFNLFPNLNILENLKIGNKIVGKSWNKKETIDKLKEFDIDESILESKVFELSGGEQQRISILRALERDSRVLLVDEPTANLDEENGQKVFETLKKASKNKTTIVVTHDLESAQKYVDNIYEIKNNSISLIKKNSDVSTIPKVVTKDKNKNSFLNKLSIFPTFALTNFKKHKVSFLLISLIMFLMMIFSFTFTSANINLLYINPKRITALNFDAGRIWNNKKRPYTKENEEYIKKAPHVLTSVDGEYYSENPKLFFEGKQILIDDKKINGETIKRDFRYENIPSTEFFQNRLKSIGITGQPISGDNQIVLGKLFADKINDANLIGKNVVIDFGIDGVSPKTLKVVGINNNLDGDDNYLNYFSENVLKGPRETRNYVTFAPFVFDKKVDKTLEKQPLPTVITKNEQIILGSNSNELNSLLISTKLAQLWKEQGVNITIGSAFQLNYYKDVGRTLKVSGIFTSDKPEIRLSNETIKSINEHNWAYKEIYVNPNYIDEVGNYFVPNTGVPSIYNFTFSGINFYRNHVNRNTMLLYILTIVSFVIGAATAISLITFPIILAKFKKKEIGAMKLLGAKFWQLVLYNISTFVVITFVMLIAVIITALIGVSVIYNTYVTSSDILINYGNVFKSIFIIWISTFLIGTFLFGVSTAFVQRSSYKKIKSF